MGGQYSSQTTSSWLNSLNIASVIIFMGVSLALMVYAWRLEWPLWSASWFFYAAWIGVIVLGYLLFRLAPDAWMINAVLILGGLAGMAVGYLVLYRRSRLHAVLAALFLMPVATQFELEAIPNSLEAFISLLFGTLAALAAIGILRTHSWAQGVIYALTANLVAGIALTYICFYRAEIPGFYGDSFLEAAMAFTFYFVLALALFIGPLFFCALVDRIRRSKGGTL